MTLTELRVAGLPPKAEVAYLEHYCLNNPRAEYAFHHLSEEMLTDYQILDEAAMDRSAFYTKYLAPMDLRYFLSGQLFNTKSQQAVVSIQRTRRQGHVQHSEIARMRRVLPHLCRAVDLAGRLRTARAGGESLDQVINSLSDGVALLGADGGLLHANAALTAIAAAGDGIRLSSRGLDFNSPAERAKMDAALGALAGPRRGDASKTWLNFCVPRPSGAPAYLVSVRPIVGEFRKHRLRLGAAMLVFIRDSQLRNPSEASILRAMFGLTNAEADLARALQTGISPVQYGRDRSLSLNTVYTHLRRIKDKTGTQRMAELIHRLNSVRMPIAED
jgi:DNA-binding CsgD family transcriptional regulator/PAS domain-containing protein